MNPRTLAVAVRSALEILAAGGHPTQPLPVPETLEALVQARLAGLPATTREALVLVSAAGKPSGALLRAANVTQDVLEPALAAHVIESGGDGIGFTHRCSPPCSTRESPGRSGVARTGSLAGSSRTRSVAYATSRSRRMTRMPGSPLPSRTLRSWRTPAGRRFQDVRLARVTAS